MTTSNPSTTSSWATRLPARLAWAAAVAALMVLQIVGVGMTFYIEGTTEAVAEAEDGLVIVVAACLGLLGCLAAARAFGWRPWIWLSLLVPVLAVGGATVALPETVFNLLAVPVAVLAVGAGALGAVLSPVARDEQRPVERPTAPPRT